MPIQLAAALLLALAVPASAAIVSNLPGETACLPSTSACIGTHEGGAEGG